MNSEDALARVWQAMLFSMSMTNLLHRFPGQEDFDRLLQHAEFSQLKRSNVARFNLANNYTGLPYWGTRDFPS